MPEETAKEKKTRLIAWLAAKAEKLGISAQQYATLAMREDSKQNTNLVKNSFTPEDLTPSVIKAAEPKPEPVEEELPTISPVDWLRAMARKLKITPNKVISSAKDKADKKVGGAVRKEMKSVGFTLPDFTKEIREHANELENKKQTVGENGDREVKIVNKKLNISVSKPTNAKESSRNRFILFGYQIVSVLRAMGKTGDWTVDEASKALETLGLGDVKKKTIQCQIGGWKYRGECAPLTSEQWDVLYKAGKKTRPVKKSKKKEK